MNNRPTVFPLGAAALGWLRQGGRPTRAGWAQRILYGWRGWWFERNLSLQRYLNPASPVPEDPVFILGMWRSGTTFMHDLLGACPEMICPATWQCMSPDSFRLSMPPVRTKTQTRPMDGFTIDALSPQEDEFALLALGVPSVYRGFLDPRRLPELACWLDPEAWSKDSPVCWMDAWQEFLAGVANGSACRLLLKSPNHAFRIRALTDAFPAASFIWLVRDPEEVFFSNRKMWIAMFKQYALWEWDTGVLDDFLRQALEATAKCLTQAATTLQPDRLVVVDFRQLTQDPVQSLCSINSRLTLGEWGKMERAVRRVAESKSDYRRETYLGQEIPLGLISAVEQLKAVQDMALSSHGI